MLPGQQFAFDKYLSGSNLFIGGSAGAGKSYVIKKIITHARERCDLEEPDGGKKYIAKTAMTGCAACLIGGTTLHSWACIGLGVKPVKDIVKKIRLKTAYAQRWRACRLLIIDEISMMSAELFEKLDTIARTIRDRPDDFFGGIQVVFSGDFAQLPPIEKGRKIVFVFESPVWRRYIDPCTVYLTQIVRQTDPVFQEILTQVRMGILTPESRAILKSRVIDQVALKSLYKNKEIQPTLLYSYVAQVDRINNERLDKLVAKGSEVQIYYPEYSYLVHSYLDQAAKRTIKAQTTKLLADKEALLEYPGLNGNRGNVIVKLTVGSQVLLTYNLDVDAGLANGTRGIVIGFDNSKPIVLFDNGVEMTMDRVTTITEQLGVDLLVSQYPLALAWATTIHKAIGSTISQVVADLSNCFECGQAYVALSRCRSIEGLYLTGINFSRITCHPRVREYYQRFSYKCKWVLDAECQKKSWREFGKMGALADLECCPECLQTVVADKIGRDLAQIVLEFVQIK